MIVKAYKADDGTLYLSEKECTDHNKLMKLEAIFAIDCDVYGNIYAGALLNSRQLACLILCHSDEVLKVLQS